MLFNQLSGYHWGPAIRHIALVGLLSLGLASNVGGLVEFAYAASTNSTASGTGETESGEGLPGNTAGGGTRFRSSTIWLH